jgi:hypothetical protein
MTYGSPPDALNKAFCYEIAVLLMNQPMSITEVSNKLPYKNNRKQTERAFDHLDEENIIEVLPTRGTDEYVLNHDRLSERVCKDINIMAINRIRDPAEEHDMGVDVEDLPDTFFVYIDREFLDQKERKHSDYSEVRSLFEG